jgi:hypothetical protein
MRGTFTIVFSFRRARSFQGFANLVLPASCGLQAYGHRTDPAHEREHNRRVLGRIYAPALGAQRKRHGSHD